MLISAIKFLDSLWIMIFYKLNVTFNVHEFGNQYLIVCLNFDTCVFMSINVTLNNGRLFVCCMQDTNKFILSLIFAKLQNWANNFQT